MVRQDQVKAWVSIMYGCNNFCSYCIVPYVRGRERPESRRTSSGRLEQLAAQGYKDITLLGQNVNSYGRDLDEPCDFADLLERVNAVPGDFLIRFMTSHPKDATQKLFETMARCEKVAPVLHLPFQAGNDRVLKVMNRRHTIAEYLDKIRALKALIPDIVLTSDVIVGFPGETTAEFEDTLKVLEAVRFDALFTFIFSPRPGTPAADMDDPMTRRRSSGTSTAWWPSRTRSPRRSTGPTSARRCAASWTGRAATRTIPSPAALRATGWSGRPGPVSAVGTFAQVEITGANKWSLFGRLR